MWCVQCGNFLFLDGRSVTDLASQGYLGGRYYCVLGCRQADGGWHKHRAGQAAMTAPKPSGKYDHEERLLICERCHKPFLTRGTNTKRDPECARGGGVEQQHVWDKRHKAKLREARLAAAVAGGCV